MRIAEGIQSLLQMSGMLARLCKKSAEPNVLASWRQWYKLTFKHDLKWGKLNNKQKDTRKFDISSVYIFDIYICM